MRIIETGSSGPTTQPAAVIENAKREDPCNPLDVVIGVLSQVTATRSRYCASLHAPLSRISWSLSTASQTST